MDGILSKVLKCTPDSILLATIERDSAVLGYQPSSDPTRGSRSDFPFSRPGKTTFCLIVVPRPHGEFNLNGYLTCCFGPCFGPDFPFSRPGRTTFCHTIGY